MTPDEPPTPGAPTPAPPDDDVGPPTPDPSPAPDPPTPDPPTPDPPTPDPPTPGDHALGVRPVPEVHDHGEGGGGEGVGEGGDDAGADAVRSALNRARAAATSRGQGVVPGRGVTGAGRRRPRVAGERRSGSGPDDRDPQLLGRTLQRLVAERGWTTDVAVGGVMGRWDQVVGPDVAAHCHPEEFEETSLTVRTDSTAWATQVRLLVPTLLRRLAEDLGPGVVTRIVVRGPAGPSWRRGPRTAPGRGPRDTYG